MKNVLSVTALASFAIAGWLATAAPARAESAMTLTQMVKVGDLDLTSAPGRAELRTRVLSAAKKVCGPNAGFGEPGYQDFMRCVSEARRDAMTQANRLIEQVASR